MKGKPKYTHDTHGMYCTYYTDTLRFLECTFQTGLCLSQNVDDHMTLKPFQTNENASSLSFAKVIDISDVQEKTAS